MLVTDRALSRAGKPTPQNKATQSSLHLQLPFPGSSGAWAQAFFASWILGARALPSPGMSKALHDRLDSTLPAAFMDL